MIILQALSFSFGATIGSFLNVVILRYLSGESVVCDRSRCPHCRKVLRWWELVPLFSYIYLRGRCARCHRNISSQYPLIEFAAGLIFLVLASRAPLPTAGIVATLFLLICACLLLVLFMIDLYTKLLPHMFMLLLLLAALGYLVARTWAGAALWEPILGAAIGFSFLGFLWLATRLVYGQPGIGEGDVLLVIPLGLLLGWQGIIALLFIAFVVGGGVSLVLLTLNRGITMKTAIPFGPFLAGAAILLLLAPQIIVYFSQLLIQPFMLQ